MIIGEGSLKDIGRVIIWFFLRYLILIMPPPSEFALTRFLGSCFYHLSRTKRMVVRENLESVLGDRPSMDGLIKQAFQNHFVDQYLIFSFPKMNAKNMGRYVSVEGLRHLNDALARGKGVIMIHGHVGLRLLPLFGLAVMGYRMYQIEGPVARGLSLFGRYCARQKTALEKRIPANILGGQRFLRPIFEALSRNEIVMIAGDGTGGGRFMGRQLAVRFMGHRLKFPAGPVLLASKTGATLVPLFTLEGEGGAPYRAVIHPSWVIAETRLGKRELVAQVESFVRLLESVIREHPHLWHFWDEFYERTAASDAGDESRP
jgi:lauroyl/myristoyl acyltransferase